MVADMNGYDVSDIKISLSKVMTVGQISEAQKRAEEFVDKKSDRANSEKADVD